MVMEGSFTNELPGGGMMPLLLEMKLKGRGVVGTFGQ